MKRDDDVQSALDAGDEAQAMELARGEAHLEELVEVNRLFGGAPVHPADDGFTAGVMAALDRPLEDLDVQAAPRFDDAAESAARATQGATVTDLASRRSPAVWIAAAAAAAGLVATGGLTLWGGVASEQLAYAPAEVSSTSSAIGDLADTPTAAEAPPLEEAAYRAEPEPQAELEGAAVPADLEQRAMPPATIAPAPVASAPAAAPSSPEGDMDDLLAGALEREVIGDGRAFDQGEVKNRPARRTRRRASAMSSARGGSRGGLAMPFEPEAEANANARPVAATGAPPRPSSARISDVRVLGCLPDAVASLRIVFRVSGPSITGIESTRPSQSADATRCLTRLFEGHAAPSNGVRNVRRSPARSRQSTTSLD